MTDEEPKNDGLTDPESWVDLHGDVMFRFALLRVRDRTVAEEVVQEALLAAFRSRHRFSGKSKERTWLIQILRNKIVDHYRRRRREVPASELAGDDADLDRVFDERGHSVGRPSPWRPDPGDLVHREEFLLAVKSCMERLPERQGEAFALRVLDERSTDDSAEVLGVTKTNLGVLLHRARLKMKECLEATWFGGGR